MTLFMDNQFNRLLLPTINPQELSLIIYPPPPQRPIRLIIVYQIHASQKHSKYVPQCPSSGTNNSFSA